MGIGNRRFGMPYRCSASDLLPLLRSLSEVVVNTVYRLRVDK